MQTSLGDTDPSLTDAMPRQSPSSAREAKVGYKTLTKFHKEQIAKDAQLIKEGFARKVEWHFFTSTRTGKGGPSKPLREALEAEGITVIEHLTEAL